MLLGEGCGESLEDVSFGFWDELGFEEKSENVHRRQLNCVFLMLGLGRVSCGSNIQHSRS